VEEDRVFIIEGPMWTSAGMTPRIDLVLAMIEQDLGMDVARAVVRQRVVYHQRAGGQSQFSAVPELEPKSDRIKSVLGYAKRNLDKPLTVGQLAAAAHLRARPEIIESTSDRVNIEFTTDFLYHIWWS